MLSPRTRMVLIPAAILSVMTSGVAGLLTTTYRIENQAALVTVGIGAYWDLTAIQICDHINWETLRPGQQKTVAVYFKNTGTDAITGSFTVTEWDPPEAENYISLEWDFGEATLLPGRVRMVHFTLKVSPDVRDIENFYFTIMVTGTQYIA